MTTKTNTATARKPQRMTLTSRAKSPRRSSLMAAIEAATAAVPAAPGLDSDAAMPAEQIGEVVSPAKAKAKKLPTHKQAIAARAAELVRETGVDKATAKIQAEQWLEIDAAATGEPQYRGGPKRAPKAAGCGATLVREPGRGWFHIHLGGARVGMLFTTTKKGVKLWAASARPMGHDIRTEGANRQAALAAFVAAYAQRSA